MLLLFNYTIRVKVIIMNLNSISRTVNRMTDIIPMAGSTGTRIQFEKLHKSSLVNKKKQFKTMNVFFNLMIWAHLISGCVNAIPKTPPRSEQPKECIVTERPFLVSAFKICYITMNLLIALNQFFFKLRFNEYFLNLKARKKAKFEDCFFSQQNEIKFYHDLYMAIKEYILYSKNDKLDEIYFVFENIDELKVKFNFLIKEIDSDEFTKQEIEILSGYLTESCVNDFASKNITELSESSDETTTKDALGLIVTIGSGILMVFAN